MTNIMPGLQSAVRLFFAIACLLPVSATASEDILVRTFQPACEHADQSSIPVIPVWFVACCALPEAQIDRMCEPNLANDGRLAASPDLNLLSLYQLRAAITRYDHPDFEVTLDLSRFSKPAKVAIGEEAVLKAAVECLRRIAGDSELAKVRVVIRSTTPESVSRWKFIEGTYESIVESGEHAVWPGSEP
jgi:hypothetical protein